MSNRDGLTTPPRGQTQEPGDLKQEIAADYRSFRTSSNLTEERRTAALLIKKLEKYLQEPKAIAEIEKGAVPDDKYRLTAEIFPEDFRFRKEWPFDKPGRCMDRYFFYADGGFFSPLYKGGARDPAEGGRYFLRYGPKLYAFEKRYASSLTTRNHILQANSINRCLRGRRPPKIKEDKDVHWILGDPKGLGELGIPLTVVCGSNLRRLIELCDYLSECLEIRFIVATQHFVHETAR